MRHPTPRRGILHEIRATFGLTPRDDVDLAQTGEVQPRRTPEAGRGADAAKSRYDIGPEIARGGMGAIFRVHDADLRRDLAMKVLLGARGAGAAGGSVHPEHLTRFLEEAQVTAQLAHPGVVPVHDLGMDADGRIYFTMDLVRGRTLNVIFELARRKQEGWTRPRALQTILRVCETLAFAHEKGVIHRDLKPENVMIGRYGETYVMDWGLAKVLGTADAPVGGDCDAGGSARAVAVETVVATGRSGADDRDSPALTMDGAILGTPAYMSPEQATGALQDLDRRSDVYSIGALLYELLAGHPPYIEPGAKATPVSVLVASRQGPPKRIAEIDPAVPEEIAAICEKAMARDRNLRYASAKELAEDIQAFIDGRVVKAYRTGTLIELRKWIERNRGTAAAMGVAVVALVAGLVVSLELMTEAQQREEAALRLVYRSGVAAASVELATQNVPAARARLADLPGRLRGWEWRHLSSRLDRSTWEVEGHQFVTLPDGRVLVGRTDGGVDSLDPDSGETKTVRAPGDRSWLTSVANHCSGLFASRTATGYTMVDPLTGEAVFEVSRGPASIEEAAIPLVATPDRRLLAWSEAGEIRMLDRASGTRTSWSDRRRAPGAISSDATRLLVSVQSAPGIHVIDVNSRRTLCSIDVMTELGAMAFISADTRFVYGDGRSLACADAATGQPAGWERVTGFSNVVRVVDVSADGALVAAGAGPTVHVIDAQTGDVRQLLAGEDSVIRVQFTRDGRWLLALYANQRLRVWDVGARRDPSVLVGHHAFVYDVAVTDDGARIVSGGWDGYVGKPGSLRVWDAATGEPVAAWGPAGRITEWVAVSADGRRLFSCGRGLAEDWQTGRLDVWDAATGEALPGPFAGRDLKCLRRSPDGRFLAAAEAAVLHVFDAGTLATVATFPLDDDHIVDVAFRPDGERIAAVSHSRALREWPTRGGEPLLELRGEKQAGRGWQGNCIGWSADGARIFRTVPGDNDIHVLDAETGRELARMRGHGAEVFAMLAAPRAGRVFSAGNDNCILVWEADTFEQVMSLPGHGSYVYRVALSPDGGTLVSASGDGTLRLWNAEPARSRQQAIFRRRQLVAELEPRVRGLFEAGRTPREVVDTLRADPSLTDARRREVALQLALRISVERREAERK